MKSEKIKVGLKNDNRNIIKSKNAEIILNYELQCWFKINGKVNQGQTKLAKIQLICNLFSMLLLLGDFTPSNAQQGLLIGSLHPCCTRLKYRKRQSFNFILQSNL